MSRAVVLPSGQILDGRYRVDHPVGEGGFATVYAGLHLTLGVRVAIKALHLEGLEGADPEREADQFADFIDEGKLVTRLRHDHIVRTLDQGIWRPAGGGRAIPYLVLEWCGEESLEGRLRRDAKMSLAEAYAIVHAVTLAMAHAHESSVVHRDIKPANVMLARGPGGELVPRVIDFGIAKVFEDRAPDSAPTVTRSAGKVTPAYAAPEQLAGMRSGPFTDVHAIGLLFYELATGRKPFAQGTALGNIDPDRPTPARVGVDVGAFEPVIAKAVALRPADRHPDARALARALEAAARATDFDRTPETVEPIRTPDASIETVPPTSHTANGPFAPRRSPLLAAALMIVAVLALSGLYVIRGHASGAPKAAPEQPVSSSSATVLVPLPPSEIVPPAATSAAPVEAASAKEPSKKQVAPPTKSAEKTTKVEVPNAPSASVSKGIGGIVEKPPF
ncbi:MAG: protein kinase domain-containing protein [Polyangiales bacterium]